MNKLIDFTVRASIITCLYEKLKEIKGADITKNDIAQALNQKYEYIAPNNFIIDELLKLKILVPNLTDFNFPYSIIDLYLDVFTPYWNTCVLKHVTENVISIYEEDVQLSAQFKKEAREKYDTNSLDFNIEARNFILEDTVKVNRKKLF